MTSQTTPETSVNYGKIINHGNPGLTTRFPYPWPNGILNIKSSTLYSYSLFFFVSSRLTHYARVASSTWPALFLSRQVHQGQLAFPYHISSLSNCLHFDYPRPFGAYLSTPFFTHQASCHIEYNGQHACWPLFRHRLHGSLGYEITLYLYTSIKPDHLYTFFSIMWRKQ